MKLLTPNLSILPEGQQQLWPALSKTPSAFVLYGGTALALQLGHRPSVDFDFFSQAPFDPRALKQQISYLADAEIVQSAVNTLTCRVPIGHGTLVSFFGGLNINRVNDPLLAKDTDLPIASIEDVAACKCNALLGRATWKDYVDLAAILNSGVSLEKILISAKAVYGNDIATMPVLKAMTYTADVDTGGLTPAQLKQYQLAINHLEKAVSTINKNQIIRGIGKTGLLPSREHER